MYTALAPPSATARGDVAPLRCAARPLGLRSRLRSCPSLNWNTYSLTCLFYLPDELRATRKPRKSSRYDGEPP